VKLGMIGLGRMGGNMAERLRQHGHEVVGYDAFSEATEVGSLEELAEAIGAPGSRVSWVMVPAGEPTEDVITELRGLLAEGDLVIDGGNSNWRDSVRRGEALVGKGIGFIDCGTSGGVWGLENGYALMVGGRVDDVSRAQPVFDALTPENGGFGHVGPVGAGHYTKMVHNGIEYGMMQAFAEGYEILAASELGIDVTAAMESWREGSVVRSWLLDLAVDGLRKNPGLQGIAPVAKDSGEGRWTVEEAVRLGVPANVIAASLWSRFLSQKESQAMKMIAMLRAQFGGHAIVPGPEPPDPVARTEKGEG
jgi:6-phosphogluconate dehydrogenase